MCFSLGASVGMVALGGAATAVTLRAGRPPAIPFALAYFTFMEALQVAGYMVINQCGTPVNETVTWLSVLHIAFQPLVINAFTLELMPETTRARWRWPAMLLAGLASLMVLLQLAPLDWAGTCIPGTSLCGSALCTVSGEWHLAWDIPYNGLFAPVQSVMGIEFGLPTYFIAVFALPLCYGAWKFTLFHMLVGPIAAGMLTANPNEMPAIWCLFSIGIILAALSPRMWRVFERREAVA